MGGRSRGAARRTPRRDALPGSPALDPVLELIRSMWAVDHELHRVSKRMVGRMGLTAPQRLAVRFIGLHPGITLGELAALMHLHPGTVTGIVKRLEGQRLAGRARNTEDTRRMHLTLTAGGRALDRRRTGTVEGAVRRAAAALRPDEVDVASRVMLVLAEHLSAE